MIKKAFEIFKTLPKKTYIHQGNHMATKGCIMDFFQEYEMFLEEKSFELD